MRDKARRLSKKGQGLPPASNSEEKHGGSPHLHKSRPLRYVAPFRPEVFHSQFVIQPTIMVIALASAVGTTFWRTLSSVLLAGTKTGGRSSQ